MEIEAFLKKHAPLKANVNSLEVSVNHKEGSVKTHCYAKGAFDVAPALIGDCLTYQHYQHSPSMEAVAAFKGWLPSAPICELEFEVKYGEPAFITMKMEVTPAMLEAFSRLITKE